MLLVIFSAQAFIKKVSRGSFVRLEIYGRGYAGQTDARGGEGGRFGLLGGNRMRNCTAAVEEISKDFEGKLKEPMAMGAFGEYINTL